MESKLSRWCDGLIEAGWIAAVIVTPLFFNIHSDRVFEPDKLTLLRSIALLMSAAWLVKAIDQKAWQQLKQFSWRENRHVWRMPFVLPVVLIVFTYIVSTLISVSPRVSWAGSYQRLQGTYTTFSYIVVFFLTLATMRTRAQVSRVVSAVIITSIPVSFYGLLQHFELDPLPWGGNTSARIAGHMGNAIFIAAYLIMAVPLTVARIIDAFTSILGDEELAYADVVRSSVYIFALAIQLIAIYWSSSRGPWLGLAAALFAFILIVLVTLRDAASSEKSSRIADAGKSLLLIAGGTAAGYVVLNALIGAITESGRMPSLAGPTGSFVSFIGAAAIVVVVFFIMIAARRGWRWLWLAWMLFTLSMGGWLAAFNFADELDVEIGDAIFFGSITERLVEWQHIPAVGRLGRLLESESGTGKVRVLIWEGALELISIHEPLRFPNREEDRFNFLRPLFGYGPESMYVAYNRFYPPELATVEARNASPDRSHNETFDALVITGAVGFLVWQALYLSVFYYGFSWLGVVRGRRDRGLLAGLWIGGAAVSAVVVTALMGLAFLGVAIPLGSILGLIAYLVYYALSARQEGGEAAAADPFQVDRLLMIGLVTAILAHYVEIHFGIAIASTRTHFFVFAALMFTVGFWLPRLKEETPESEAPIRGRKVRSSRRRVRTEDSKWGPVLLNAFTLSLVMGIMGYEFTTYALPPDKVIQSPADLTAGEIFRQSFLINAKNDFSESPFLFLMIILTWVLAVLICVSEMVKSDELSFANSGGRMKPGRRQVVAAVFGGMAVVSLGLRFLGTNPEGASTTQLLGRSLLLIWFALCGWSAWRLFQDHESGRLLGGAVAFAGLLFSIPILVAGGGFSAAVVGLVSLAILYLMWDESWYEALLPSAVLALVAVATGLAYAFVQASALRDSLFLQGAEPGLSAEQLRLLEAEQSSSFLTIFYLFTIGMILLIGTAAAWNRIRRERSGGTTEGYLGLIVVLILAFVGISSSNMRIIQADVLYKRAKPFDSEASRVRNADAWNVPVAIYEEAVEMVPQEDFYYLFLGRAYLEQSSITTDEEKRAALLRTAEARLLEAQEINPLNTDHTANLARLNTRWAQLVGDEAERAGRLQEAERYYQDALALSPQNSIIRNEYARLAFDLMKDCDQAIEIYQRSIDIDPYYVDTYFGLADIYIACAQGDVDAAKRQDLQTKAVSVLRDGLSINDRSARVWLQLGQVYQELGAFDQALQAYDEGRLRNTDEQFASWQIDYWMATAHLAKGDTAAAEALSRQALNAAPPEMAGQIQAFINSFSENPIPEETSSRPLAAVPPAERNGYFTQPPPLVIDVSNQYEAVLLTAKGEMRFSLFDDLAPLTVNNFVYLASQGFYDGVTFHRVLENFMAQAGDPLGNGFGGPGYQFPDETANGLSFDRRGLLAMANAGPNTNGSQFFITFAPLPGLNGRHTIFGELVAGDDVLGQISLRDPDTAAEPGDLILRVEIEETTP